MGAVDMGIKHDRSELEVLAADHAGVTRGKGRLVETLNRVVGVTDTAALEARTVIL